MTHDKLVELTQHGVLEIQSPYHVEISSWAGVVDTAVSTGWTCDAKLYIQDPSTTEKWLVVHEFRAYAPTFDELINAVWNTYQKIR